MRIFLTFFLIHQFGFSFLSLTPYSDWAKELKLEKKPKALPTEAERQKILAGEIKEDEPQTYLARLGESGESLFKYWNPLPSEKSTEELKTASDYGKYTVAWVGTRMSFISRVAGINQNWCMYSPNVSTISDVVRYRLIYADGSERMIRTETEPEDITRFSRWFKKKRLAAATLPVTDWDSREGYCRMLSNLYEKNAEGSELVKIEVIKIRYDLVSSDCEDPLDFLQAQQPPRCPELPKPFWSFDPKTGLGRNLK